MTPLFADRYCASTGQLNRQHPHFEIWQKYDSIASDGAAAIGKKIAQAYTELRYEVRRNFKRQHAALQIHAFNTASDSGDNALSVSLFDKRAFKKRIAELVSPAEESLIDNILGEALDELQLDNLDAATEITDEALNRAIDGVLQSVDTAGEDVARVLRRLRTESVDDVADALERRFDFYTEAGAKRTALTVATGAKGYTQREAYMESGIGAIWVCMLLPTSRKWHVRANGQRMRITGAHRGMFYVGGEWMEHPGDPTASAGNICNCHCGLVADIRKLKTR